MSYSKTNGHHCFWLKKGGKSLANFDNESDVDDIINLEARNAALEDENAILKEASAELALLSQKAYEALEALESIEVLNPSESDALLIIRTCLNAKP